MVNVYAYGSFYEIKDLIEVWPLTENLNFSVLQTFLTQCASLCSRSIYACLWLHMLSSSTDFIPLGAF